MNRINWTELETADSAGRAIKSACDSTQITTIAIQYIDSAMVGAPGANASAAIGLVFVDDVAPQRYDLCGFSRFFCSGSASDRGKSRQEGKGCCAHGIASALVVSLFVPDRASDRSSAAGWLGGAQKIRRNATLYFMMFAIMLPFSQLNSLMSSFLQCSGDMVTRYFKCRYVRARCHFNIFQFRFSVSWVADARNDAGLHKSSASRSEPVVSAIACVSAGKEKTVSMRNSENCIQIGVPVAVQEIAMNSAMVAATMLIAPLGSIAIAANSFAVTAEGLCYARLRHRFHATTLVGRSYNWRRKLQAGETLQGNICIAMGV